GGGDPPQRHAVHAVELAVVASDPEGTARRPVEGEEVATVGAEHGTKSLRATAEQEAIVARDPDLSGPGPDGAEMGLHAHVDPLPARVGAMQDQAVAADGPGAAPEVFDRLLLPRLDAQAVSIPERQSPPLPPTHTPSDDGQSVSGVSPGGDGRRNQYRPFQWKRTFSWAWAS